MEAQIENFKYKVPRRILKLVKSSRQFKKNLYSFEDFMLRLTIERRRSERVSYKTSIIFLSLINLPNDNGNHQKYLENITRIICSNLRATDVVSLHKKERTILILLPDTNNNGAQCACKRVVKKIIDGYSSAEKFTPNDFHIKILSFPEKQAIETAADDSGTDDNRSNEIDSSPAMQVQNELTFKREYFENLNLCMSIFNGSTISIPIVDMFFWDQQFISKFLFLVKKLTKRIMDIVGSILGILLFLPIMLIVALMVKMTSPGPILFKQRRVGYKGKYFTFLKFRSMFVDNEDRLHQDYVRKLIQGEKDQINNGTIEKPFYKIVEDPRITPFGRFMRKMCLDELPQFFNVLKGEMSLVGPRPPIPYEVKEYQIWHFRRVLEVKPGITGLWQVSGRSRTTFDEMVRLDIKYAENWSLLMDLKILFKTVKAVFSAEGT